MLVRHSWRPQVPMLCAVLITLCFPVSSADASSTRSWAAIKCRVSNDEASYVNWDLSEDTLTAIEAAETIVAWCPVYSDASFSAPSATAASMTGWANNNVAAGLACVTYYDGSGGACGDWAISGTNTWYHLAIDTSGWSGGAATDSYFIIGLLGAPNATNGVRATMLEYDLTVP